MNHTLSCTSCTQNQRGKDTLKMSKSRCFLMGWQCFAFFISNVWTQTIGAYSLSSSPGGLSGDELMLFDFTSVSTVDDWVEQSDTVRSVGMSKAVLLLQKTQVFQRAVFFSLLNPQPNGAGFAGVRTNTSLDLHNYRELKLHLRGQGANAGYKIVLRHKNQNNEPHPTYEQFFQVQRDSYETINLPLVDFEPYYRGRPVDPSEAEPLDTSHITSFGLQVYGGVYLPVKQSGPSTLEIDWIKAVK